MIEIDKNYIQKQFEKSTHTYEKQAIAQRIIAQELCCILAKYQNTSPENVWEFGCGSGLLSNLFLDKFHPGNLILNDLNPPTEGIQQIIDKYNYVFMKGDAENIRIDTPLDLVISSSTFQWFENPEKFILKCANYLKKDALFAFSTFTPDNLKEIKLLADIGLIYPEQKKITEWLENHFEILEIYTRIITLHFSDVKTMLKHLSDTGVNGIKPFKWTPRSYRQFSKKYEEKFSSPEGLSLTYSPVYFIARKKTNK